MTPHRVIQWATGNTGLRALREVIRHPALDLVGTLVYDPAKDGVDAGELCGEGPTGVLATTDREAILALEADCVIYMPRATGRGQTRAGLTEDELVDDVVALVGSGTNIVTTCSDLFARGVRLSDENRARVRAACRDGQFLGVGERQRSRVHHRDPPDGPPVRPAARRPDRHRGVR